MQKNDVIYRQDAIELAMQYCPDDDGTCSKADEDMRNLLDELEDLPSAQPESYKEKLKEIADALSEKFAYMNTCLNERDIILGYLGVKRPSKIHCNTDCTNIKCESHRCNKKLPSAQFKRIDKEIHEITESDKISYAVICDKFPNPHVYFNTYDEAEHWARFNQPNYRPFYIIERSEHFEIAGEVK